MDKNTKSMNLIQFAMIALIIVLIPILMDWFIIGNNVPSNITNSEWVSFLGSYIGGIIGAGATITGVYIVNNLQKKNESQGLKVYLEDIFNSNITKKEEILINFFDDLRLEKISIKAISLKIYEDNLLTIYKFSNYKQINELYEMQEELEKKFSSLKLNVIETNPIFKEILEINQSLVIEKHSELSKNLFEFTKLLFVIQLCILSGDDESNIGEENLIKKFPYTSNIFEAFNENDLEGALHKVFQELLKKAAEITCELQDENYLTPHKLAFDVASMYSYYKLLLEYLKKCKEFMKEK